MTNPNIEILADNEEIVLCTMQIRKIKVKDAL